jgi:F0F1-type ATP synthase membrane subunit a
LLWLETVLFSPFLAYCVLATQTIAVLLNIGDEGYSGFTCKTKNFIQYFFDRSDACGKLWVGTKDYPWILMLCGVMVIIFICNLMWLRAGQNADRHKDVI